MNHVKEFTAKIKAGKLCLGMAVTLSDPSVSELAGEAGCDFTWIDMEHSPLSLERVLGHVIAARAAQIAPLVRVPWNEWGVIKPVLDLAPAGVIIPMVNNAADAARAVASCRYPPKGNRGCGLRRGNRYGAMPFDEYLRISEREPLVIIQIEHRDALKNLDEILAVEGLDSICIGPYDLSASFGKIGQIADPEVSAVIDEICRKARAAGKIIGTATALDASNFESWRKRGLNWVAIGGDCGCMFAQLRRSLTELNRCGTRKK
jgi:2-dehydro-3-deoxyglucarate aldolase/4-hydroxy-2-oxoheptanedioate aldolase